MIIQLECGGQLVVGECHWVPGAYFSAGNQRGSQGVIIAAGAELDTTIAELTRIRDTIDDRKAEQERKKVA